LPKLDQVGDGFLLGGHWGQVIFEGDHGTAVALCVSAGGDVTIHKTHGLWHVIEIGIDDRLGEIGPVISGSRYAVVHDVERPQV